VKYRGACSTGVARAGKHRLRIAWTYAGIAFVDAERRGLRLEIEKRMRMRLKDAPVPKLIRESVGELARGKFDIDVPIDLTWARDFERDVLLAARSIPWGETRPYSWLAREARRPLAVRAAASIIARNPLWLFVPWHRVIYKDGHATRSGRGGPPKHKEELLAREQPGRSKSSSRGPRSART
jgi:O-6-methylguanine DNA methyltransferase